MSRAPIRIRVTAALGVAMAAVLAASGLFLYVRLSANLASALDRQLQLRAQDLAALVAQPRASLARDSGSRFIERGESYAQLIGPDGRILQATRPLGSVPVLSLGQVARARNGPIYIDLPRVRGLDEGSRLLATPVRSAAGQAILVVGATRENDAETLASFRRELVIAGPLALVLACAIGYLLAGLSLQQVEAMRRRASAISADNPGERLPVPPTRDEVQRLGETLNEMLDRLEGGAAARTRFSGRRRARAAHAARAAAHRA